MKSRDQEQQVALTSIRKELSENKIALCVCATGYGKGHLIKLIAKTLKEDMTMLVIVPRVNLVIDLSERTGGEVYCASLGKKNIGKITVATKQSIKDIKADLVILDEAHTYTSEFLSKVKDSCTYLIGMTATPYTQSGYIHGNGKLWPKPCYEFSIEQCIDSGFLTPYKIYGSGFAFDTSKYKNLRRELRSSEIDNIIKTAKYESQVKEIVEISRVEKRKKIAIICSNIEHATNVYNEVLKYEPAHLIHSKIKNSNTLSEKYKHDDVRFSVSVIQLSEGYDNEYIDCIALLRPTRSTRLAIQIYGRGLRLSSGKDYCLILDYAQVAANNGTPHNPVIPDGDGNKSQVSENPIKQCEECFFIWEKKLDNKCPSCGHIPVSKIDVEEKLQRSLASEEAEFFFFMTRDAKTKFGTSRNGIRYMSVENDGAWHTLFNYQYKAVLSAMKITGRCKVFYNKKGKYKFKFLRAQSF